MKVYAFKVEPYHDSEPLVDVLESISKVLNIKDRIRTVNGVEMRVEVIEERNNLWLLDFVKIRTDHGPGKVNRSKPIVGFQLGKDDGFGEETAAIYDPKSGYMLIQYNHNGVRHGSIEHYLSDFNEDKNNIFLLKPKLDDNIERRLMTKSITKKLSFVIDIGKLGAADKQAGRSLSEVLAIAGNVSAGRIAITLTAEQGKQTSLNENSNSVFNSLRSLLGSNPDAVKKLEYSGKDNKDSLTEVLDLIAQRLCIEFDDIPTGEADKRYPLADRWEALLKARKEWVKLLTP